MQLKTKILNTVRELFKISFLEKLLRSLTQQKAADSFWVKLAPNNYQYPKGSKRFAKQNGLQFELDISDLVDWYVYFGIKEEAQERLFSLCKKDATIIDVGTNIGKVLMNFSKLVGNNGKVIGFEPDSFNHQKCKKNLALNPIHNVELFKLGLGNSDAELSMVVKDEHNRGMNRIVSQAAESEVSTTIKITTLDAVVKKLELTKIDLIKIDVEGFEFNVLSGAETTLQKFHPTLFIELDDANLLQHNSSAQQLIQLLDGYNYSIQRADTNEKITEKYNFTHCHFDIICT